MSEHLRAAGLVLTRAGPADAARLLALQRAAYAPNRILLGVEPLPLLADYDALLATQEVWLAVEDGVLAGAIMLEPRPDDLLLWSISTNPALPRRGLGRALLAATEERARQLSRNVVRLYTGTPLTHLVAWYGRHGYAVEQIEQLSDRSITHMVKRLDAVQD